MSILPIVTKVKEYNLDKPSCTITEPRALTELDQKRINEITQDILKMKLPYTVQIVVLAYSRQLYLRCITPIQEAPKAAVVLPRIKKIEKKI